MWERVFTEGILLMILLTWLGWKLVSSLKLKILTLILVHCVLGRLIIFCIKALWYWQLLHVVNYKEKNWPCPNPKEYIHTLHIQVTSQAAAAAAMYICIVWMSTWFCICFCHLALHCLVCAVVCKVGVGSDLHCPSCSRKVD